MQDYKRLCVAVTICAIVVAPKLDFFTNQGEIYQSVQPHQMHLRCKFGDHRSVTCEDNAHINDDPKTQ